MYADVPPDTFKGKVNADESAEKQLCFHCPEISKQPLRCLLADTSLVRSSSGKKSGAKKGGRGLEKRPKRPEDVVPGQGSKNWAMQVSADAAW